MKLSLRFLVLVVALLVAVGAIERQGVVALDRLGAALERVVDSDMERVFAITHVRRLFRSMVVLEGDYLLSKSETDRKTMDKKMLSLAKEQLEQIDKYSRLMPPEDANAISDIRLVRNRWITLDDEVRRTAATNRDRALELSKQHLKDPINWEKVIGSLVKLSETRLSNQVMETKLIHQHAKRNLMLVALSAFGVALGFGLFIYLGIQRNVKDLVVLNTNLEKLVGERTAALAAREHSLRLVLDSTGDAFIELGRNGKLTGVSSAATIRWFGEYKQEIRAAEYLFPNDTLKQRAFDVSYSQLIDDILPWELTSEQMPKRIHHQNAILELEYKKVVENGELSKILIVARDVTVRVHSEAAEKNAKEQQTVLSKLLSDKAGFVQFVADCEALISSLTNEGDLKQTKRNLHTLKGNTAVYGMSSVAEYCHQLEDQLASTGELLPSSNLADLATLWRSKLQSIQEFLSEIGDNILEIDGVEHQKLIDSLMSRRDYQEILGMVEMWSWCRASERLTRLRAQTEYIAKRLEKKVVVVVEHHDIRIPKDYLNRFWPALIHVVRNAVGHGVESPDERVAQGKPPHATITLSTYESNNELFLEVRDDGRGIDLEKALAVAKSKGVQLPNNPSILDAITMEGFSTSTETTDLSGRGVGLSAVRHACEIEGGQIEVINRLGEGVSFRFKFRMPVVKTGALAAKLERRWSLLPPNLIQNHSAPRESDVHVLETTRKTS
jgi:two-component system chemotaxis sensor kinase CheA